MRIVLAMIVAVALLGGAPAASAGPICENRAGESVRCEDPRAMPLGWTLPLDERLEHSRTAPPDPTALQMAGVFILIVLLFTLIALMPDFDGWAPGGPDPENEGGDEQS